MCDCCLTGAVQELVRHGVVLAGNIGVLQVIGEQPFMIMAITYKLQNGCRKNSGIRAAFCIEHYELFRNFIKINRINNSKDQFKRGAEGVDPNEKSEVRGIRSLQNRYRYGHSITTDPGAT